MPSFHGKRSELATTHRLSNRTVLLPFEAELCNTVGITKEEYFEFLARAEITVVRSEGYEHVPDVRNGPVAPILVNLAIGLVLTAASALLAPKPRGEDDEPINVKRPDQIGQNRFTPTFSFNSVQELARLGQTVPLVFADQPPIGSGSDADAAVLRGGTRANSLMTFSLASSVGSGQRLRLISVAGFIDAAKNYFAARPDYEGLAFGDQLVNDFNSTRIAAYFRGSEANSDGPIKRSDQYNSNNDEYLQPLGNPSNVWWHPSGDRARVFAGVRNPSNETTFGAYSPMPNANFWRVDFKMYINPDSSPSEVNNRIKQEKAKINSKFPIYAAITNVEERGGKVTEATYRVDGTNLELNSTEFLGDRWSSDSDVTAEDVKNEINQERLKIDSTLNEGELYLLGNQLGLLIRKSGTLQLGPMEGNDDGSSITCTFRMLDDGGGGGATSGGRPTVMSNVGNNRDQNENNPTHRTHEHYDEPANQVQAYAEAIVANNVACDCTEIGIGSTVWKKFSGCNVNNWPGYAYVRDVENNDRGGSYDMGTLDVYVDRYSFFELQIRKQGQLSWQRFLQNDGYFAVLGRNPVERFNAIRIYHPRAQYEFRLRPVASKFAYYRSNNNGNSNVYLLNAINGLDVSPTEGGISNNVVRLPGSGTGFFVYFEGTELRFGGRGTVSNPETFKGPADGQNVFNVSGVVPTFWAPYGSEWALDPDPSSGGGANPYYKGPTDAGELSDPCQRNFVVRRVYWQRNETRWIYYWKGERVADFTVAGTQTPINEVQAFETNPGDPFNCNNYRARNNNAIRYYPSGYESNLAAHITEINIAIQTNFYYPIQREIIGGRIAEGKPTRTNAIGGSGAGLRFNLQKFTNGSYEWSIREQGTGYRDGDRVTIAEITDSNFYITVNALADNRPPDPDPGWDFNGDTAPYSKITDYYMRTNESGSHHDQPEHRITYVNELILASSDATTGTYKNLASLGLTLRSSKQATSLNQLSAYYKEGLKIENLSTNSRIDGRILASHVFPEIAYFLLTNRSTGAGNVISPAQIDRESFKRSADFCRANEHFWDGVIDEKVNIRDFIFKNAAYCLLDFTMKGGKFGLEPAVPYNSNFTIQLGGENRPPIPEIKGLFTDGNISDMRITTLPPEERKLMEVEVLHREERINQFPVTRSYNVSLAAYDSALAVETFDLTQFCTSRRQALNFAKYALKTRQLIDHTIEFKTTMQSMAGVGPGDYVRVVSELSHPNRFLNGHVTDDGIIQAAAPVPNNQRVYYWNPSFAPTGSTGTSIKVGNMPVDDSKTTSPFFGCVFAAISSTTTDRVYKIDSIAIGENGFVDVNATHMPVNAAGELLIMQGWANDDDFRIDGQE